MEGAPNYGWFRYNSAEQPRPRPAASAGAEEPEVNYDPARHLEYNDIEMQTYFASRRKFHCHRPTIKLPPPPKDKGSGSWEFVQYVPEWTDPQWADPALLVERDKPAPSRTLPLERSLRPAQLPKDAMYNPTPYATRFGIFPGRTDGRSRLSPTTDGKRQLFARSNSQTETVTAKDATSLFLELAKSRNMHPENLLDHLIEPQNYQQLNETDRFVVDFMEDLRQDQNWQSIFFMDLTTDEMIQEGLWEITDDAVPGQEIDNDIHQLFAREKWQRPPWSGSAAHFPRYMYRVGDRRGEWCPKEDDWLWERLQPALRLTSKLWRYCTEKDPFWRALLDPFNREAVEENRDFRYEEHQEAYPSRTFSTAGHSQDEDLCHPDAKWLASKVDGVAQTLDTLEKRLTFRIDSSYHDEDANLYSQPGTNVAGTTGINEQFDLDEQITVKLGADILYPLLFDGYSRSEQFMSAFVFSATVIHELAHAVNFAHGFWLLNPGPEIMDVKPADPAIWEKLRDYGAWLYGKEGVDDFNNEPFFEYHQRAELGHAMESQMFGGSPWALLGAHKLEFRHLSNVPAGVVLTSFPGSRTAGEGWPSIDFDEAKDSADPQSLLLRHPHMPRHSFYKVVRHKALERVFTEDFWSTEIIKYGSSALLMAPEVDSRILCPDARTRLVVIWRQFINSKIFGDGNSAMINWLLNEPSSSPFVRSFIDILLTEKYEVIVMSRRWAAEALVLARRLRAIEELHIHVTVLDNLKWLNDRTEENKMTIEYLTSPQWTTWRQNAYDTYKEKLDYYRTDFEYPTRGAREIRWHDPPGAEKLETFDDFWANLESVASSTEHHVAGIFKRAYNLIATEMGVVEHLFLETWHLSRSERQDFLMRSGPHLRAYFTSHVEGLLAMTGSLCQHSTNRPGDPDKEWFGKFTAMAERLELMKGHVKALSRGPPDNWADFLSMVPHARKSRRSVSERWMRVASTEIGRLDLLDLKAVSTIMKWLRGEGHPTVEKMDPIETPRLAEFKDPLDPLQGLNQAWSKANFGENDLPPVESLFPEDGLKLASKMEGLKRGAGDNGENQGQGQSSPAAKRRRTEGESSANFKAWVERREAERKKQRQESKTSAPGESQRLSSKPGDLPGLWHPPLQTATPYSQPSSSSKDDLVPKHPHMGLPTCLRNLKPVLNMPFAEYALGGDSPMPVPSPGTGSPWKTPGLSTDVSTRTPSPFGSLPGTPGTPGSDTAWPQYGSKIPAPVGIFPAPQGLLASTTRDIEMLEREKRSGKGLAQYDPQPRTDFSAEVFQKLQERAGEASVEASAVFGDESPPRMTMTDEEKSKYKVRGVLIPGLGSEFEGNPTQTDAKDVPWNYEEQPPEQMEED